MNSANDQPKENQAELAELGFSEDRLARFLFEEADVYLSDEGGFRDNSFSDNHLRAELEELTEVTT